MEEAILQGLSSVGAMGVVFYLVWKKLEATDKSNREDTNKLIDRQENRIAKLEDKSEREHALFSDAVSVFRESVTMLSGKMDGVDYKVSKIEKDVNELKQDK